MNRGFKSVKRERVGKARKNRHIATDAEIQKFYRSIPWDRWWDDFLTARDKNGELTYSTAWSFCKANGNDRWEQQIIFWCIGPKPTRKDGKPLQDGDMPVKWLGDWYALRQQTFGYSDAKIETLKTVLEERATALDAARGVATVALDWVAKAAQWSTQIEVYFNHAMLPAPGVPIAAAERRARTFLSLQKQVMKIQMDALHEYLRCNGVDADDVSLLAQMAAVGAQAALKGVKSGAEAAREGLESTTLGLIMKTFQQKAEIYSLGMPEAELIKKVEGERVDTGEQPAEDAHARS